jgi:hypothetical protein
VCEFNFSGLPLHLRPKKKKDMITFNNILECRLAEIVDHG